MSMTPRYVRFNEMMFTDDDLYYEARNALLPPPRAFSSGNRRGSLRGSFPSRSKRILTRVCFYRLGTVLIKIE